ncbi:hypothetical protein EDD18DRAFT_1101550 [Armillaria luteobubalina]|uniref:Uncharacterized protein n=1 Tax=Armillaria luteobubalina TaxID=153913 RepID=A0AA39QFA8_9AGAR|nr:hypothetical protein EDD18DRAFT_1101550 [Armillaria luteobubalina]
MGIQQIILESITVVCAGAIMGRQCRILWTFLGLLTLSTIASLLLYLLPVEPANDIYYFYLCIAARAKANYVSDVRRFNFSVPLSVSIAGITATRMLCRLQK